MKKTLKDSLVYLFSAILGAFTFVLFALPYTAVFVSYGKESESETMSGYRVMDLWDADAWGVLSSLFQIFVLIAGILIFAWGVCGLLKGFGVFKAFPDKIGKLSSKKLSEYALVSYAVLNILLVIFLAIFCIVNTEELYGMKAGIRPSGGMFAAPILSAGAYVAYKLIYKKISK